MNDESRIKNLSVPDGKIDVVLDTDAYNEIDDQFAIAYLLRSKEKLNTKAIYAAPFFNSKSKGPRDGMEKSYDEIFKLLSLMGETVDVFRGSEEYLPNENTPIISSAAKDLAERAKSYSPEKPLYVVAIGAITNVASAILIEPEVANNTVVVWLGGNALHFSHNREFNLKQDIAAARVVMSSGVPFVQLPCMGVVSAFSVTRPELDSWLVGKNPLADYLARNTIEYVEEFAKQKCWSKPIWDVTAVAWLLNDDDRFMLSRIINSPLPSYDGYYTDIPDSLPQRYVYHIKRDELMSDLFEKILSEDNK